jgi:hypothetical protein
MSKTDLSFNARKFDPRGPGKSVKLPDGTVLLMDPDEYDSYRKFGRIPAQVQDGVPKTV